MFAKLFTPLFIPVLIMILFVAAPAAHAQAEPAAPEIKQVPPIANEIIQQNTSFAESQGAGFSKPRDPRVLVAEGIRIALTIIGILFAVYTIYGGYLYMTAVGKEDRIEKGMSILTHGVLGVIIIIMAYSIAYFVVNLVFYAQNDHFTSFSNWGIIDEDATFYGPDYFENKDPLEQSTIPKEFQLGQ